VNGAVSGVFGPMVMDPSDLIALPSVLLAWRWMKRGEVPVTQSPWLKAGGVVAAALASMATSQVRQPYPRDPAQPPSCIRFWVESCAIVNGDVVARLRASPTCSGRVVEISEERRERDDLVTLARVNPAGQITPGQPLSFDVHFAGPYKTQAKSLTTMIHVTHEEGQERQSRKTDLPATCKLAPVMDVAQ
jgi:hypothetical protein